MAHMRRLADERRRLETAEEREKMHIAMVAAAMAEDHDVEALRAHKRVLDEEERRIRALLDIERARCTRREDLSRSQQAERARAQAASHDRHVAFKQLQEERARVEREALRIKLGLPIPGISGSDAGAAGPPESPSRLSSSGGSLGGTRAGAGGKR
jgi:hypothetical protein